MTSLLTVPWLLEAPRKIYVASSWRNEHQPAIVDALRDAGHLVYDFKSPAPDWNGFHWSECGAGDVSKIDGYLRAVFTDVADKGFAYDKRALDWCDTCVLVLPCGRSAHLEAGYAAGQGKRVIWWLHPDRFEPELMYRLGHDFVVADA